MLIRALRIPKGQLLDSSNIRGVSLLWREAIVIVLLLALQRLGAPGAYLAAVGLVLWSLRSTYATIQALTLSTILIGLNPYIFGPNVFSGLPRWAVLIFCSLIAIIRWSYGTLKDGRTYPGWLLPFISFSAVAAILSVVSGYDPEIALFKLGVFVLCVLASMFALSEPELDLNHVASWFFTVYAVMLGASILLLHSPLGYISENRTLFMGITGQSQWYGATMIPWTVWLLLSWISGRPLSRFAKLAVIGGTMTVFLSNSRTSVYAAILSILFMMLVSKLNNPAVKRLVWNRLFPGLIGFILLLLVANILGGGIVSERLTSFAQKTGKASAAEAILQGREGKRDAAMTVFKQYPVTGKGFGLGIGDAAQWIKRDPVFGLPISAPVEAGAIYTAAPAQLGLVGTVFFLLFLVSYYKPIIRKCGLPEIGLACVCFFINCGEYVYFSPGGLGSYHWLLYAFAYSMAIQSSKATSTI